MKAAISLVRLAIIFLSLSLASIASPTGGRKRLPTAACIELSSCARLTCRHSTLAQDQRQHWRECRISGTAAGNSAHTLLLAHSQTGWLPLRQPRCRRSRRRSLATDNLRFSQPCIERVRVEREEDIPCHANPSKVFWPFIEEVDFAADMGPDAVSIQGSEVNRVDVYWIVNVRQIDRR